MRRSNIGHPASIWSSRRSSIGTRSTGDDFDQWCETTGLNRALGAILLERAWGAVDMAHLVGLDVFRWFTSDLESSMEKISDFSHRLGQWLLLSEKNKQSSWQCSSMKVVIAGMVVELCLGKIH